MTPPFLPGQLYAARYKPISEYPQDYLCCAAFAQGCNRYAGVVIVVRPAIQIPGTSMCSHCYATYRETTAIDVYWIPGDDANCAETFQIDIDEKPLTQQEYERIILAPTLVSNSCATANGGSN